jgi:rare lipoprotein A
LLCLYSCCCLFGAPGGSAEYGLASYYGADFDGRKTASGEIFDQRKLSCAHRDLPFGTRLRVTNLDNKKTVVVRVNDRGPWVSGRIVDLSYAAADKIGMIQRGVVKVKIEIVR